MIPFPGESIALFQAWSATGSDYTLGADLQFRDGSRTISAGDEWRAWVSSSDTHYLEDGTTPVVVSWVVEVGEGTVTLAAAEGIDPDYGNPALTPSTDLGTHTVTGPATLLIPSTATGAQVYNAASADISFMLVLNATAGSADVQQVKLRVWPPDGVEGGWGDVRPGFNTDPVPPSIQYADAPTFSGTSTNTDPQTAWDDAYAAFIASVAADSGPAPRTLSGSGISASAFQNVGHPASDTYSSTTSLMPIMSVLFGQDWRLAYPIAAGLVEGIDWIVPPTEVPADTFWLVQRTADGATGWLNATATATAGTGLPGHAVVSSVGGEFTPVGGALTLPINHGGSAGTIALDTSGRDIVVTASHTLASGDGSTWPGWIPSLVGDSISRSDGFGYALGDVQTYAIVPPYRLWAPTAATPTQHPLRLMQRSDGLGMGSGRVLGVGTRQASTRVLGSL